MNKNQLNAVISTLTRLYRQKNYPLLLATALVLGASLLASQCDGLRDLFAPSIDPDALPNTPGSFSTAKKMLYSKVYKDRAKTFYCGCDYDSRRRINLASCQVHPRQDTKRAARVEAEHIVPASWFGHHRQCWNEPICTDSKGKAYKGRRCCEDSDPVFETAHNDLHNLMPAVGEVNGDRKNYRFGMITGEKREYGQCDFEVDSRLRRAEPPPEVRGDIARVSFYMEKMYGVALSDQQRQLFTAWSKQDPVDAWERERNQRIEKIQGNRNPFVDE